MSAGNPDQRRQPGGSWPLALACAAFLVVALVTASITFRYIRVPDVDALLGSLVVLAAWSYVLLACWRWPPWASADRLARIGAWLAPRTAKVVLALAMAIFAITLFTAIVTLQTFPNSGDEYAQLFQAATYLDGRLTNPMPADEIAAAFRTAFTEYQGGSWFGRYPPGWSTLLAAWHAIGLPYALANPCLGVVAFLLIWRICIALELPRVATLACLLLAAANGFFIFNAASYFAHTLVLVGALLFVLHFLQWQRTPSWWSAVMAGIGLGIVGTTRHLEAVIIALPPLLTLLWASSWRHRLGAAWILVGGAPFLLALLWYHEAITGDPLLPPMVWSIPNDTLRFFAENPERHPLQRAALFALGRLITWAQWTSPPMLPAYAGALIWLGIRRQLRFFDLYLPLLALILLFYWGYGGNQYGPRYYHVALPFAALTIVRAAVLLAKEAPIGFPRLAVVALGLMVLVAQINLVVWSLRVHQVVTERRDLYRLVDEQELTNALVIVVDGTSPGNRMDPKELIRNGIDLERDVVFAMDVVDQETLRHHFDQRMLWRYERPGEQPAGKLTPVP